MGYFYTSTVVPASARTALRKRSKLLLGFMTDMRIGLFPQIAGLLENKMLGQIVEPLPSDRIHRELKRRIEALREIRKEAALSPGNDEDFETWTRARDRGAKLSRALMDHLLHRSERSEIRSL